MFWLRNKKIIFHYALFSGGLILPRIKRVSYKSAQNNLINVSLSARQSQQNDLDQPAYQPISLWDGQQRLTGLFENSGWSECLLGKTFFLVGFEMQSGSIKI